MRPSWVSQGFGEHHTHSKMSSDGGGSSINDHSRLRRQAERAAKRELEMDNLRRKVKRMEAAILADPALKAAYEQELLVDVIKGDEDGA